MVKELDVSTVVSHLRSQGIWVLEGFIRAPELQRLRNEFDQLLEIRIRDVVVTDEGSGRECGITAAQLAPQKLPAMRSLFMSESFRRIATAYMPKGTMFCRDIVATHDFRQEPITDIHFDLLRALKFMVYLLDTDEGNGAFSYAAGTHTTNARFRRSYLLWGGRYHSLPNIPASSETIPLRPVIGPAGTLIVFDTDGFHCGGVVSPGRERKTIRARTASPSPSRWQATVRQVWGSKLNAARLLAPALPAGRRATGGAAKARL